MFQAFAFTALALATLVADGKEVTTALPAYSLPPDAERSVEELAARSDLLILDEMHGTTRNSRNCCGLPGAPFTARLWHPGPGSPFRSAIANHCLGDRQKPKVPSFYATPWDDGRGSVQMLSLIRTALSPPLSWKLICFDQSAADDKQEFNQMTKEQRDAALGPPQWPPPQWVNALGLKRDAGPKFLPYSVGRLVELPKPWLFAAMFMLAPQIIVRQTIRWPCCGHHSLPTCKLPIPRGKSIPSISIHTLANSSTAAK